MPTSSWAWGVPVPGRIVLMPRCVGLHAHEDVGMPPGMDRRMKRRGVVSGARKSRFSGQMLE